MCRHFFSIQFLFECEAGRASLRTQHWIMTVQINNQRGSGRRECVTQSWPGVKSRCCLRLLQAFETKGKSQQHAGSAICSIVALLCENSSPSCTTSPQRNRSRRECDFRSQRLNDSERVCSTTHHQLVEAGEALQEKTFAIPSRYKEQHLTMSRSRRSS